MTVWIFRTSLSRMLRKGINSSRDSLWCTKNRCA